MTEEKIREYSLRISQCSRSELVVITDEIVISYVNDARTAFNLEKWEDFRFQLRKARQFIDELSSSLDMRYEISYQLMSLYCYVRKCLIHASIALTIEGLDEVIHIMEALKKACSKVATQDKTGKVMENSQKVYAGLTYGPGSKLNEIVL